uniref:CCHC-type domain-containing protein n=1 Tax=Trichuris muris TaxID=70415 RepID=A0A5S6Q536_TRIMR
MSTGRLPSRRPPDTPKGPDVVNLATSIGEAIANRLAAQISSSLETLRLDVSSLATKGGACGSHDRRSSSQANGMSAADSMSKVDLDKGQPDAPDERDTVSAIRDGPAVVSGSVNRHVCHGCECDGCPELRRRLPKLEIPRFTGDPLEWPMFSSAFHQSVHSVLSSDADRLCILRELLAPEIRRSLAKYLYDPRQYNVAMEVLQRRYGDPQRLVQACLRSITALRTWNEFDYDGLSAFSDELASIVSVLSLGGHEVEICSSSNVSTVVKKMPRQLRDQWGSFVVRNIKPRFPNLRDLSDWITERREAADVVAHESDNTPWRPIRSSHDKRRKPRVMVTAGPVDHTVPQCTLCSGGHWLPSCPTFMAMRPEQRAGTVKRDGCCYRCLMTGHTARQCSTRTRCTETGCQTAHHPMLHGAPRLYEKRQSTTIARCGQSQPFTGKVCQERAPECLLPVVPLTLITPDGRRYRTRALLDSGSEITMVHMDVANALGLHGPKEACCLTTFYDQRPVSVQRVSFKIESSDGQFSQNIEDAYAVSRLQLPIQALDLNPIVRRLPFLQSVVVDTSGPPDVKLLIGMDYPAAHAAFESRSDQQNRNGPHAILTLFGWSIVGPLSNKWKRTQQRHCYRLALNTSPHSPTTEQLLDKFSNSELTCTPLNDDKAVSPDEKRA